MTAATTSVLAMLLFVTGRNTLLVASRPMVLGCDTLLRDDGLLCLVPVLLLKHITREQRLPSRIIRQLDLVPSFEGILHHILAGTVAKQAMVLEVVH